MNITDQLVNMLTVCKDNELYGYEGWDQVLVDQYNADQTSRGGSNCLQKPYNIHRNRLKTLAFYY